MNGIEVYELSLPDGRTAIVDAADRGIVEQHRWYALPRGYVATTIRSAGTKRHVYIHRLLMAPSPDVQVDHINHNPLDNRRANLRVVSASLNQHNRRSAQRNSVLGLRNVHWEPRRRRYLGEFQVARRRIRVGSFKTPEAAAQAVAEARRGYRLMDGLPDGRPECG
jgi:hypothetical protein